ncbi:MAG TPA: NDP-sugar synthase, partial [Candidatus Binatus sp.]|nr:NDP-sugar synthase [Candidatus Binatus sp.]
KLLFPIVGVPLIDVMIDWLKTARVSEVILAVNHLADRLKNEIGENRSGVDVQYSIEKQPLGTGGPIRLARKMLGSKTPFLVLNGDIVTNLDLNKMIQVHKKSQAQVTIALVKVPDPSPYGLVQIDKDERIRSFEEKTKNIQGPGLVNAGVYVLSPEVIDRIPGEGMVSIERQVYPILAREGLMNGWVHNDGYWHDIGKIHGYMRVNRDLLERSWRKRPGSGAQGTGPFHIGKGSRVHEEARIGPYSILSDNVTVKAGATINDSIVFEEAQIDVNCHVEGPIIGERVHVGKGVRLVPGTLVAGEITIPAGRVYDRDSIILNA